MLLRRSDYSIHAYAHAHCEFDVTNYTTLEHPESLQSSLQRQGHTSLLTPTFPCYPSAATHWLIDTEVGTVRPRALVSFPLDLAACVLTLLLP